MQKSLQVQPVVVFETHQRVLFFSRGQWFEGIVVAASPPWNYQVSEYCEIENKKFHGNTTFSIPADQIRSFPSESIMTAIPVHLSNKIFPITQEQLDETKELGDSLVTNDNRMEFLHVISNRRQLQQRHCPRPLQEDPFENSLTLLPSILPKQRDLRKLACQAQNDPFAMLQLADAYRFGLWGVTKDRNRATTLYACAAWGLNELEFEERTLTTQFAYPRGTPEALCAYAMDIWEQSLQPVGTASVETVLRIVQQQRMNAQQSENVWQTILATIVFFVAHSLRRGWISSFALDLGRSLRDMGWVEPFLPNSLYILNILEKITEQSL